MRTIEITTEVTGRDSSDPPVRVTTTGNRTTVRELIEAKLRAEIAAWRRYRRERFGLEYGEWNTGRRDRRTMKEEVEVAKAIDAFTSGRFFVFVGSKRMADPDEAFDLAADSRVRFVRLVPLAGG